jgi:hypothetical protein
VQIENPLFLAIVFELALAFLELLWQVLNCAFLAFDYLVAVFTDIICVLVPLCGCDIRLQFDDFP